MTRLTRVKICVLKILNRFVVCLHVKDRFFVESCTFVHFRVQVLACLYQIDILIIRFASFLDLECTESIVLQITTPAILNLTKMYQDW